MVRLSINEVGYQVFTQWGEVDIDKLMAADGYREELKVLSTIPEDILSKANEDQLLAIYMLAPFVGELEVPMVEAVNVRLESYEKFETAKDSLKSGKEYQKVIKVAKVYYESVTDPATLLGYGNNLIAQIAVFLESFKDMVESKPTAKQINAGIDELSTFGAFGTVLSLAGDDITRMRAVWEMNAQTVYLALYYNWKKDKYQRALLDKQ